MNVNHNSSSHSKALYPEWISLEEQDLTEKQLEKKLNLDHIIFHKNITKLFPKDIQHEIKHLLKNKDLNARNQEIYDILIKIANLFYYYKNGINIDMLTYLIRLQEKLHTISNGKVNLHFLQHHNRDNFYTFTLNGKAVYPCNYFHKDRFSFSEVLLNNNIEKINDIYYVIKKNKLYLFLQDEEKKEKGLKSLFPFNKKNKLAQEKKINDKKVEFMNELLETPLIANHYITSYRSIQIPRFTYSLEDDYKNVLEIDFKGNIEIKNNEKALLQHKVKELKEYLIALGFFHTETEFNQIFTTNDFICYLMPTGETALLPINCHIIEN